MTKELETIYERFCIMTESMSDEKAIMLLTLQTELTLMQSLKDYLKHKKELQNLQKK